MRPRTKSKLALFTSISILTGVAPVLAQQAAKPSDIPIASFAQLPVMEGAELSPDGSHLAYFRPARGRKHLIIQQMNSDAQPVVVPPVGNLDFHWLHWANDNRLVFSVSATAKRGFVETKETRLLAINEDGSKSEYIVRPSLDRHLASRTAVKLSPAQIQDNVIDWLPNDPDHILVGLDGNHDGADEVRLIDIRDGDFDVVQKEYAGIQDWMTDQSGEVRLGWGVRNTTFSLKIRQEDGEWRTATNADWRKANFFPQGFSDSPDIVYMRGPDENGYTVMRTMSITSGEFLETVFQKEGVDVGSLVLDPLTTRPVAVSFTEHQPRIEYFDRSLAALQRAIDAAQPGLVNTIVSITRDRRQVLIHSASDVDAGAYLFLDRDEGSLIFIAESMPGLLPELMSPIEPVSYKARDGLRIQAYLTVPRGFAREQLKVVVMPHGGPASRDDKSFWFLSQFLASRGYAIFQPNFRGSTGYGRNFERAGRKEWGGKMQEDVTDGVRWLLDEGIADPDGICIVGWSYGGYSAAIGAVQTPDLYQCAASINGVMDLPRMIADDRNYIGGSVWSRHVGLDGASTKSVSPYHQAEHIQIPMLIIQAKDDARVHLDQGKRMANLLKRLRKPVEYVEVDLGGHNMSNEMARQTILRSLESFLAENLGTP